MNAPTIPEGFGTSVRTHKAPYHPKGYTFLGYYPDGKLPPGCMAVKSRFSNNTLIFRKNKPIVPTTLPIER